MAHQPNYISPDASVEDTRAAVNSLKEASQAASKSPIAFDMEGQNLGDQGGVSRLIALAPTSATSIDEVFLFDVGGKTSVFLQNSGIKALLESSEYRKVTFDCRRDASALRHGFECNLSGAFDLQLLDVASRRRPGPHRPDGQDETLDEQLRRLSGPLHRRNVQGQMHLYLEVHKLNGLMEALREHSVQLPDGVDDCLQSKRFHRVSDDWAGTTPLPQPLLRYAAGDVLAIAALYRKFDSYGLVDDLAFDVEEGTKRYVSLYSQAPPKRGDAFQNHALLPQGILLTATPMSMGNGLGSMVCSLCNRSFPVSSFSKAAVRLKKKMQCATCKAISIQQATQKQWDKADEYECYGSDDDYECYD